MVESTNISQFSLPDGQIPGRKNKNTQEFVYLHMVKWFTPLLLILCPLAGYGQFGVNVKYLFGQSEVLDEYHFSQDGIHASLEYGFRLKSKRLEFHPGLGYRFTFFNNNDGNYGEEYDYGYFNSIDLDFNTSIYPFDFGGDCDCPTWSKEGTLIKKGFFLEFSPGLAYQTFHFEYYPLEGLEGYIPLSTSNLILKASLGAGLDIGLTDQFTLTPTFSWTVLSNAEWKELNEIGFNDVLDDQTYLSTGLRFTYKPDPKRRRRF